MPTTLIDRPANGEWVSPARSRPVGVPQRAGDVAIALPQRLRTRCLRRCAKGLIESGERLGAPLRQFQVGCAVKR